MAKPKKEYNDYSTETIDFINAVHKFLKSKHDGKVPKEFSGGLNLLYSNYETFLKCKKQVKEDGLMIKNHLGDLTKHPLIKVGLDAQIQIIKLLPLFYLTEKSVAKKNDDKEEEESPLEEFLRENS
jgi:phage terminase small subunit